jgi:hypothetical protein
MGTASEYLAFAQECTRWATEAKSEKERKDLLDMARIWTQLALSEKAMQHRPINSSTPAY